MTDDTFKKAEIINHKIYCIEHDIKILDYMKSTYSEPKITAENNDHPCSNHLYGVTILDLDNVLENQINLYTEKLNKLKYELEEL